MLHKLWQKLEIDNHTGVSFVRGPNLVCGSFRLPFVRQPRGLVSLKQASHMLKTLIRSTRLPRQSIFKNGSGSFLGYPRLKPRDDGWFIALKRGYPRLNPRMVHCPSKGETLASTFVLLSKGWFKSILS